MKWFKHFRQWLGMFPAPRSDYHLWIKVVGDPEFTCWCGVKPKPDEHYNESREELMNRVYETYSKEIDAL